ncbi:alpha-N-arabinofuranosidase [Actinoplanes solisilvae]|uniref:arabinosylfuranosidase ArfA n=1 Tax=Actinoplanes solisilvae TaxID=2486853 RepID=UPI001F0C792F|nr:alpha-N-arabinofuranosidase [Actinoplanes solisilvae]
MTASLHLDPSRVVAPVSRRTFGSFVEHMGRCVYGGLYEPSHPAADEHGFREDVLALVREMGVTLVRYPGGNFVSGYRWEDGIGPVEERPVRRDLAWHSLETNEVGVDEFMRWAAKADVEVMYALNLGTRGVQEALDAHEYLNHPDRTRLASLRHANGVEKPYGIRMFCLGNEMDGPWQTGHKTAHEYGRLAAETARALRSAEPGLELVACGSSSSSMPTFGAWEATVLELAYDQVDYISAHAYYEPVDGDLGSFLASAVDMDHFVAGVTATADSIGARLKSPKRINISFDEWNVWYLSRFQNRATPAEWETAPRLIEDTYNVADAVVVGSLLISLLRHSDRVTAACQAQLVNVIAPIRAEPSGLAWRQTTFHPFALTARLARGSVLNIEVNAPTYETKRFGEVPALDAVATHDPVSGSLTVFAVNRHQADAMPLSFSLAAFDTPFRVAESWLLTDPDLNAVNTLDDPDRVVPRPIESLDLTGNTVRLTMPPVSWVAVRLTPGQ